ncbi:MAG TPA: cupredoxin family copper-binding protein [Candidatus Angelobacter sp.]
MGPFLAAWRVRQGMAVLLLLSASSISVAHPRFGVANLPQAGSALVLQASGTPAQNQSAAEPSANGQVIMKGMRFQPADLAVHPGETIEFKNEDIFAHTVTADDGSFDSGLIQPGSSWKMTVQKSGTIAYHCAPHPNMKATLVASIGTQVNERNAAAHGLPGFRPPRSPQELHPILVNFTAALLPLALLSDLLGLWLKRSSLHNAAAWMVLYAAIITPLTGAAGWWWKIKSAGTLPPELIAVHQWLGTSLAVLFIVLAVWRWRLYRQNAVPTLAYLALAVVAVLALVYQGSLGGAMVFGR